MLEGIRDIDFIPICTDQNSFAHLRFPIDMMRQG